MFEILFCAIDKANGEHGYAVGQLVVMLPKGTQPKHRETEIDTERERVRERVVGVHGSMVRAGLRFVAPLSLCQNYSNGMAKVLI